MVAAVAYEVVDGVAHVTLDRPDKRNAMDLEVFGLLGEHAARAAADPTVGAVVVRGRDGTFSSGLDLGVLGGQLAPGPDGEPAAIDVAQVAELQAAFTAYEELDVPTLAAIEGPCFGAGIQLAAACHLRAVAPDARLAVMEARWALVPDLGGTWRLPRLIGLGRATELTLTTREVGAEEALAIGLAQLALDGSDPQAQAHEYAARLAAGPGALRRTPRLLRENLVRDRETALTAEARAQLACLAGPDLREAVAAHLEGRAPRYVGD